MTPRWAPVGPARGEVARLHGVMALADTWWQIAPARVRPASTAVASVALG